MNYINILKQAWQIIQRNRTIWFVGLIYTIQPFLLTTYHNNNIGLICLFFILIILGLIISLFFLYAVAVSAEKNLQGETSYLGELWQGFKKVFLRMILLAFLVSIPLIPVFAFFYLGQGLVFNLLGIPPSSTQARLFWMTTLISLFTASFMNYCYFGLFFHEMGVVDSFKHGLGVFGRNWLRSLILAAIIVSPRYLIYLLEWLILSTQTPPTSSLSFFAAISHSPSNILNAIVSVPILVFTTVCFLIAYHRFIQDYEYPNLTSPTFTV